MYGEEKKKKSDARCAFKKVKFERSGPLLRFGQSLSSFLSPSFSRRDVSERELDEGRGPMMTTAGSGCAQ